ncbi:MAG: hypothetical protein C0410_10410 [Anaerolinea sp.]|nr:hypothetical protein [Anaerolinea sp.]
MIISLGILSILQLTLVPGLVLAKAFRIHGFWENLLAVIGLSQLFNYVFVVFATLLKIYTQSTVLILFGIEVVIILVLYFPNLKWNLGKVFIPNGIASFFHDYIGKIEVNTEWKKKVITFIYYFVFVVAIICLARYFFMYVANPTQVFTQWDAVVSWDKWATQWYQGIFPLQTEHYPQLWTANLSIPYQFIGTTEVKYFSKYFANLIEFEILLVVFILGIKKKDLGYFLGVLFTSWMMISFGSQGNGYADSPVAFWGLLAITCLVFAEDSDDDRKLLLLGAFFVSAAALTKQAGIWLVLVYPFLIAFRRSSKPKKSTALIIQSILIMIFLIAPWYLFKEIQIRTGIETSEIGRVTSLVLDRNNFSQIISSAGSLFINSLKNNYFPKTITFILLIILLAFSYRNKLWGLVCSLVIIPFSIGWIFFFSYESRNLDLIIPLMAIAAGVGLHNFLNLDIEKIRSFFQQKTRRSITQFTILVFKGTRKIFLSIKVWYFLFLIPIVFFLPRWVPDNRLIQNSLIKQRYMGDPPINDLIYDYKAKNGLNGKIVTEYQYLGFLPELDKYYVFSLTDSPEFIDKFNDPGIGYALFNDHWWSEEVRDYVMRLVDEKKIQLIFTYPTPSGNGTFYFVTTCHGVCK